VYVVGPAHIMQVGLLVPNELPYLVRYERGTSLLQLLLHATRNGTMEERGNGSSFSSPQQRHHRPAAAVLDRTGGGWDTDAFQDVAPTGRSCRLCRCRRNRRCCVCC
jgi:hypothetical protein